MSRINDKIQALESQLSDIQGQLEALQDKKDRQTFKRRRKAYRKKLVSDPMYRLMSVIERDLLQPVEMNLPMAGLSKICSDCSCGKAAGCG